MWYNTFLEKQIVEFLGLAPVFFSHETDQQSEFMMQLYGALILCVTLSAACGLRCYTCTAADPKSCTDTKSCPVIFNRCFSLRADGYNLVTKGCQTSVLCVSAVSCCEGDLCNSAIPAGPSVILLLVSSAILKLLF